jgi:uncharacterized membrane protein
MKAELNEQHRKRHELNRRVGTFLRVGIIISLLLLVSGLIMFLVKGGPHMVNLTPAPALITDLLTLSPSAFVTAGLFVILLMPPGILLISFAHFIATRNTRPIIVCIVLLAMLVLSYISVLK